MWMVRMRARPLASSSGASIRSSAVAAVARVTASVASLAWWRSLPRSFHVGGVAAGNALYAVTCREDP